MKTTWTADEISYLLKNYENTKSEDMLKVLIGKSKDQMRWKAKDCGLKKQVSKAKTNMSFLINWDDPEVCYWWGFICADGCINAKQIIIAVHERDEQHLAKLATKLNCNISSSTRSNDWHTTPYTMKRIACNDRFILPQIVQKLSIKPKKTYFPLNVTTFCIKERILFFLAGLIDGDGHIDFKKKQYSIRIKVHPNWLEPFSQLSHALLEHYQIKSSVYLNGQGWLMFSITQKGDILSLFNQIQGCPYMERKWNKIRV